MFLKGERCFSPKCPLDRQGAVPPGVPQGKAGRRRRLSERGQQLREKQKLKALYQVSEKQFKHYLQKAKKRRGETAEFLIQLLESRLDNLVYRLGFVPSRLMARQIISHGHIRVDGKKVDIPSYQVEEGETITLAPRVLEIPVISGALAKKENLPAWLEKQAAVGRMKRLPKREEIDIRIDDQAVIGYYSR